jgi:hypothetical protein
MSPNRPIGCPGSAYSNAEKRALQLGIMDAGAATLRSNPLSRILRHRLARSIQGSL